VVGLGFDVSFLFFVVVVVFPMKSSTIFRLPILFVVLFVFFDSFFWPRFLFFFWAWWSIDRE